MHDTACRVGRRAFLLLLFVCFSLSAHAQALGDRVDFNDQDLSRWKLVSDAQRTYHLSIQDSNLVITYTRTTASWAWDTFSYTLSAPIDVGQNPYLRLDCRSTVACRLMIKPYYANGENGWFNLTLPGDGLFHTRTVALNPVTNTNLIYIDWLIDGGSTTPAAGEIRLDNLRMAGDLLVVNVTDLKATTIDSNQIALTWNCDQPGAVQEYRIYRSSSAGVTPNEGIQAGSTRLTQFSDQGLENNRLYYYVVTAIDTNGLESAVSNEVSAQTFSSHAAPRISVKSENSAEIGLYEKYELVLALSNAFYANPYDPDEIDVRAVFTSPGGRQWLINGFYDNYNNRQQWKVRFSPNETGTWTYHLEASNRTGTGRSIGYSFTAVPSAHHGWLHTAEANPHYLEHDDGTGFYGIATYWPWRIDNSESGLGALAKAGCNFIGFWNITYDSGTIIESLSSGLGQYDQKQCNRIDEIIQWMEQRDMALMLAIWPHDLFCQSLPGWAARWPDNPYKQLCSVFDIYADETAWQYQEKQYRYIIARWGYSRGLGVWEIMNEINGTDAWVNGRVAEAEAWTARVHQYLCDHDPFNRPTTASMSGGQWWPNGYAIFDLANVHMYETGWTAKFNNNPLRSSLWTYHDVTRQMWEGFAKPAILGEAGANDSYGNYAAGSEEYLLLFHNALWASWSSGLACSPVWWAYNDRKLMNAKIVQQMKMLSQMTPAFDYAHTPVRPITVAVPSADAFAMGNDTTAFGWTRDQWGKDISARTLQMTGLQDSVYTIVWYDTWKGNIIAAHSRPSLSGVLLDDLPSPTDGTPDMAFMIKPAETGSNATRLECYAHPRQLYCDGKSEALVNCLLLDSQGRFCSTAANTITFTLSGLGQIIGPSTRAAVGGMAGITVRSDSVGNGHAQIIVSSPGLAPDTVLIAMTDLQSIDDFESYGAMNNVNLFWKVVSGTFAAAILAESVTGAGAQALRIDYGIGNGKPPFAGVLFTFPQIYRPAKYLRFWLSGDGSQRDLVIKLNKTSSIYWQYQMVLTGTGSVWIQIPLALFTAVDGSTPLDLSQINGMSLNILQGNRGAGSGTIFVDEISFCNSLLTLVDDQKESELPAEFDLAQNYPNPFNACTEFSFTLPKRTEVCLTIFNVRGQCVARLLEQVRQAGNHRVSWPADGLPSGTYFAMLEAGNEIKKIKCLLLK